MYLNFGAKKWPRNSVKFGLKNKKIHEFSSQNSQKYCEFWAEITWISKCKMKLLLFYYFWNSMNLLVMMLEVSVHMATM